LISSPSEIEDLYSECLEEKEELFTIIDEKEATIDQLESEITSLSEVCADSSP